MGEEGGGENGGTLRGGPPRAIIDYTPSYETGEYLHLYYKDTSISCPRFQDGHGEVKGRCDESNGIKADPAERGKPHSSERLRLKFGAYQIASNYEDSGASQRTERRA